MSLTADPFAAIASIIIDIYNAHKVQQWVSLIFQIFISCVIGFCAPCSAALIAGKSWMVALGYGLGVIPLILVTFITTSKLLKGMMFLATPELVQESKDGSLVTIKGNNK